ncbi:MAG: DUF7793 family protein, partial [Bacteroidia bacterium]
MTEDNVIKKVRINEATVTLSKDGIVRVLFHKNTELDVPLQMLLLAIYNEITEKKKHPFLFEAFEGVYVTKEARSNAIRIEDEAPGCAYAVVAKSWTYKIIANFYVKIKKPKSPY